jgi:hypothetical protein
VRREEGEMGSQFSGMESVKRNPYIKRLVDVEAIDENDPFWNQLLSFTLNLPLSKFVLQIAAFIDRSI